MSKPFYILSLDGGGSLGVYTLGVLAGIERTLERPLHEVFDLVYGVSTGSIIATMIALGDPVDPTIAERYFELAPDVLGPLLARSKTNALERHSQRIYGDKTFEEFKLDVGILVTHAEHDRPMVFKRKLNQPHIGPESFLSGEGLKISDAILASCAAHPFLKQKRIATPQLEERTALDGGFTANNPTLFAIADATGPLGVAREDIRILSVGTGSYPDSRKWTRRVIAGIRPLKTYMTLSRTSSNTVDTLRELFFPDVRTLRINDSFADRGYETDFMEHDPRKLRAIFGLGRKSFESAEAQVREFFEDLRG
ncbi:MAG: patatin-like phospholipase family protein [Nitrospinae bacterium]|nr:patatin-like phospholipase family protein [Nitrospinota bacterium]